MKQCVYGSVTLVLWSLASHTSAATWVVDPGGSGDYSTIVEAVEASAPKDTLLLALGVHEVGDELVIRGEGGVGSVAILGQGEPEETRIESRHPTDSPGTIRLEYTTADMFIANVTISDASPDGASRAVYVGGGAVEMVNCILDGAYDRVVEVNGGSAVLDECLITSADDGTAFDIAGLLIATRCDVIGPFGVAINCVPGSTLEVTQTRILGADVALRGHGRRALIERCQFGGITTTVMDFDGPLVVTGCLLSENGPSSANALVRLYSDATVLNSTLVDNAAPGTPSDLWRSVILVQGDATNVSLANNIVASNDAVGVRSLSPDVAFTCNLLWDNGPLDQMGLSPLDLSTVLADPLFCDPDGSDYSLDSSSPAWNGPCGQIGAFQVGCGFVGAGSPTAGAAVSIVTHPNPFNPRTALTLVLEGASATTGLLVYDAGGRLVRSLVEREALGSGRFTWDGRDERGRVVSSGVYFATAGTTAGTVTRSVVMTK